MQIRYRFFYSICKCEHRHVSALEQENKALLCTWRHRRNSLRVCCASGESLSLLFMALLFRHRCSAVCVFLCSSRHSWLRVFVFALWHTHTHISRPPKQTRNCTRARANEHSPLKHKNIMLMRPAQLFPSSRSLSLSLFLSLFLSFFQHQSPNFFHSFKEPPSRNS